MFKSRVTLFFLLLFGNLIITLGKRIGSVMDFIKNNLGIFWVLSWVLCFSTAVTLTKLLGSHVPIPILIFIRSSIGFVFIFPLALQKGLKKSFELTNKKVMILRVFTYFFGIGLTYHAYRNLPLATATSIGFSGPLFITTFAILILKEKFAVKQWALLLLGYVGVLIITNPKSITFELAILSSLLANTLAGIGVNITKILTRTESSLAIMLYGSLSNIFLSLIAICFSGFYSPSSKELFLLFFIGAFGTFSGYCYIQAVRYASPAFVAPFEYTRLLYAIPVGFIFFGEVPSISTLAGASLIVVAVYQLTLYKKDQ